MTSPEAVFDLDAFGALDTVEYAVHREGKPEEKIGLKITLAGNAHPDYQKFIEGEFRRYTKEAEAAEAAAEKAKASGTKVPVEEKSLKELREMNAKPVAARVLSANTPITFRGEKITLGPSNALAVLSDPKFTWLSVQLGTFCQDQANFMPGSAQD